MMIGTESYRDVPLVRIPPPVPKLFEWRWREPLGDLQHPYNHRTMLTLFGYSLRIHEWHCSDDKRHLHDHPSWFITFVIRGCYTDVTEAGREHMPRWSIRYRPALHRHFVETHGATTICLFGRPSRLWGFWVDGKFKRPNRYHKRWGHPPCDV